MQQEGVYSNIGVKRKKNNTLDSFFANTFVKVYQLKTLSEYMQTLQKCKTIDIHYQLLNKVSYCSIEMENLVNYSLYSLLLYVLNRFLKVNIQIFKRLCCFNNIVDFGWKNKIMALSQYTQGKILFWSGKGNFFTLQVMNHSPKVHMNHYSVTPTPYGL